METRIEENLENTEAVKRLNRLWEAGRADEAIKVFERLTDRTSVPVIMLIEIRRWIQQNKANPAAPKLFDRQLPQRMFKEMATAEKTPAETQASVIMSRVLDGARNAFRQSLLDRGPHRNSPFSPLINEVRLTLVFDSKTGALREVRPEEDVHHPSLPTDSVSVPVTAHPANNKITIDPRTRSDLVKFIRNTRLSHELRSVVEGVLGLHYQNLHIEGEGTVRAFLEEENSGIDVLPRVSPKEVEATRAALQAKLVNSLQMTIMGREVITSLLPFNILKAVIMLDTSGQIIGVSSQRPDAISPRGTTYESGIGAGTPVEAAIDDEGNLYHYEPIQDLNRRQSAVLEAFLQSKDNNARVEGSRREYPYLVDLALGKPQGKALVHLADLLSAAPRPATADGSAYVRIDIVRKPHGGYDFADPAASGQTKVARILAIYKRRGPRRPGGLSFGTVEGVLPAEVESLLNHVAARLSR